MSMPQLSDEQVRAIVGTIVLEWGHIEAALANIIICLNHPFAKRSTFERVPHTFATKRKAALRGYYESPKMATIRKAACATIDALVPLFENRSAIVHGTYQGPTGWGQRGSYLWHILETRPDRQYAWTSKNLPEADLLTLAKDMADTSEKMDALAKRTYSLLHAEHMSRSPRKPHDTR